MVVLLHGGPGAPGHMAPVARGLADCFRVLEPFQSGTSVAGHIEDLRELIGTGRPALVGSSWGAMLALAFAAAYPELAGPLVLIGCGTFDLAARARLREIIDGRMTPDLRHSLDQLQEQIPDADQRLRTMGRLITPLYSVDPVEDDSEPGPCSERDHRETWADMLRLQEEGVYPAAFAKIKTPVLMLHGAFDPHPGRMILTSLKPYLPQIDYREWEHCGHYPWLERAVRAEFFAVLRHWLASGEQA